MLHAAAMVLVLLAAESASANEAPVLIEQDEGWLTYDGAGLLTKRVRIRRRVLTAQAALDISRVSVHWAPWYQARPELRVTVTYPDSRTAVVEPKSMVESPAHQRGDIYSDARVLTAVLPKLVMGAVIEEEWSVRETQRLYAAGTEEVFTIRNRIAIERSRLVVEAPVDLPLQWRAHGIALTPRDTTEGGLRRWVFESGPHLPLLVEDDAPPDVPREGTVTFTTARSWADLAAAYAGIADRQMQGARLESLALPQLAGTPRIALVDRLLSALHRRVRYTGFELGEAGWVPRPPGETLARAYGDCKDKAAVLVAALRARGIEAHLALLRSGPGADVDPSIPGLTRFDHAIAYVPGRPDLWIDATADSARAGTVPPSVQGPLALIARRGEASLVRIPNARSEGHKFIETVEIDVPDQGRAKVVETSWGTGWIDARYRPVWSGLSDAKSRAKAGAYAQDRYGGLLSKVERINLDPADGAFTLRLEIEDSTLGVADERRVSLSLPLSDVFTWLPAALTRDGSRQLDLVLSQPYRAEREYRVRVPATYALTAVPPAAERALGPARLRRSYTTRAGRLIARFELDLVKLRWTPAEVEAFRAAFRGARDEVVSLTFEHRGLRAIEEGRVREGLAELRAAVEARPERGYPHVQYARALSAAGFGEAARDEAQLGVRLAPQLAAAYDVLGEALLAGPRGTTSEVPLDLDGAIVAYQLAFALERNFATYAALASALARDPARHRELWALHEEVAAALPDHSGPRANIQELQFAAGDYRAIVAYPPVDDRLLLGWRYAALLMLDRRQDVVRSPRTNEDEMGLLHASHKLSKARHYPQAAKALELYYESKPIDAAAQADLFKLRRLRRYEDVLAATREPEASVLRAIASGERDLRALDLVVSSAELSREGDDRRGYRLRLRGAPEPYGSRSWFVVRRGAAYEMVGSSVDVAPLGVESIAALDRGDLDGARAWLDWARRGVAAPSGDDPLREAPILTLWSELEPGSAERARVAAAALMATSATTASVAAAILERERGPLRDLLLTQAYGLLRRPDDRVAHAHALVEAQPTSSIAFVALTRALRDAGRWSDLMAHAEARLARRPTDTAALEALAEAHATRGDYARASRALERITEPTVDQLRRLALFGAFLPDRRRAIEAGQQAIERAGTPSPDVLRAWAVVLAETGRPADAVNVLRDALKAGPADPLDAYVAGRVAESYGLNSVAISAYRQVTVPGFAALAARRSGRLARAR